MDSIGFIITHIDEHGFLRFGKVGGLHPFDLLSTAVRFKNGIRGVVCLDNSVSAKDMTLEDLYLDIGRQRRRGGQVYGPSRRYRCV